MTPPARTPDAQRVAALEAELAAVRGRLAEVEETLDAIRHGRVDAIVVDGPQGAEVFALPSADHPYRVMIESMQEGAITLTADGTILFSNYSFAHLMQVPLEHLLGSTVHQFIAAPDQAAFAMLLAQGLVSSSAGELNLTDSDGARIPVLLSLTSLHTYDVPAVCVIVTDLTDQKRYAELAAAQQALRESEERFRVALKGSPVTVFQQDTHLRYTWVYNSAPGYPDSDFAMLGKTDADHLPPEEATTLMALKQQVLDTGMGQREEMSLRTETGVVTYDVVVEALRDVQGALTGVTCAAIDITARKALEAALRESERRLTLALDAAGMAMWEWQMIKDYVYWSPQHYHLFGVTEFGGTTAAFRRFLHPDDADQLLAQLTLAIDNHEPFVAEYRIIRGDGVVRWIANHGQAEYNADGVPVRILGIVYDVTERKQAEATLRANEERLRLALDAAHMVAWEWNVETEAVVQSPNADRVMGLPPGQLLTSRHELVALVHPEDRPQLLKTLQTSLHDQLPYTLEFRVCCPDGVTRWMENHGQPHLNALGTSTTITGVIIDITSRKTAEAERERLLQQLTEEERRLSTLVDISSDEIWSCDPQGVITLLNVPSERGVGSAHMALQVPTPDWATELQVFQADGQPRPREQSPLLRALRGEVIRDEIEIILHPRTGERLTRYVCAAPLTTPDGTLLGSLATVHDITEQRQREEEKERLITELQRINAEFQQFSYIVSHDLNEPLRTMHNYVQLLEHEMRGKLTSDAEEGMAFVTNAAQRMQQMLTDLLAYTRAGRALKFTMVDCEAVLVRILTVLQVRIEECGAVITHDPLPIIQGDATRLAQVLQNLIGNALKFCNERTPRIHIAAVKEDHHWRFSVRDNGIGIDPQHVGRLFQVFQRLHTRSEYAGTGIGLAICKRIVEQHDGRIWVESKLGEGSIFYFTVKDSRQHAGAGSR